MKHLITFTLLLGGMDDEEALRAFEAGRQGLRNNVLAELERADMSSAQLEESLTIYASIAKPFELEIPA